MIGIGVIAITYFFSLFLTGIQTEKIDENAIELMIDLLKTGEIVEWLPHLES